MVGVCLDFLPLRICFVLSCYRALELVLSFSLTATNCKTTRMCKSFRIIFFAQVLFYRIFWWELLYIFNVHVLLRCFVIKSPGSTFQTTSPSAPLPLGSLSTFYVLRNFHKPQQSTRPKTLAISISGRAVFLLSANFFSLALSMFAFIPFNNFHRDRNEHWTFSSYKY